MSACRALETPTRVAYLGPAGTFSEEAALGFFGSSIVKRALRQLRRGAAQHRGRLGRLRRGAGRKLDRRRGDALARPVPDHAAVHHRRDQPVGAPQPAAPRPTRSTGIEAVCAHPQALAQCHGWLVDPLAPCGAAAGVEQCRRRAPGRLAMRRWPASPASVPAANSACTWWRRRSRTKPTTARALPCSPTPIATRAQGFGPRLHQPGGVGGQPAGRGARHAGAAQASTACR